VSAATAAASASCTASVGVCGSLSNADAVAWSCCCWCSGNGVDFFVRFGLIVDGRMGRLAIGASDDILVRALVLILVMVLVLVDGPARLRLDADVVVVIGGDGDGDGDGDGAGREPGCADWVAVLASMLFVLGFCPLWLTFVEFDS